MSNSNLRDIPSVDKILNSREIKELIDKAGRKLVKYAIDIVVSKVREDVLSGAKASSIEEINIDISKIVNNILSPSMRPVLNGSGIILHTNLGRAPLGEALLDDVRDVLKGYNNTEFNLEKGQRGERNGHITKIMNYLTGAEDCIVVNNNAAAVLFILTAFGKNKESIVSRGELIEIGGAFRIPDIMKASNSKMVEVGTTNKTRASDYESAITEKTAILFKAHRSNYVIKGFTEEASIEDLAQLAERHNLISIYDIGSGLLRKVDSEALKDEPDVRQAIDAGVDIVCFSGDKLLGAGQAGIIAGKKKYIDKLKKHPLLRALRVCKTTLAILEKACSYYLDEKKLFENNILFSLLNRSAEDIEQCGRNLQEQLSRVGIKSELSESKGQYGGGTLPDLEIDSYQVKILIDKKRGKAVYHSLLNTDYPLLTNLKAGYIYVDMLCLKSRDIPFVVESLNSVIN